MAVDGAPRPAVTRWSVVAAARGLSLLRLAPATGRKHQLRVHCAEQLGAPIVGDYRYGYKDDSGTGRSGPLEPLYLHAHSLVLRQPGRRPARVVAPLPHHMRALLSALRWALPSHDLAGSTVGRGGLLPGQPRSSGGGRGGPDGAAAAGRGRGAAAAPMLTKRAWQAWTGAAAAVWGAT